MPSVVARSLRGAVDPLRDPPRDLLVAGHVNVDEFLRVRAFPGPDRTVPVVEHRAALGGTATTIAVTAARYGVASGLVARLGRHFPEEFRRTLATSHVDLRGLTLRTDRSTPTCYIVEDAAGGQRTFIDQGAMSDEPPHRFRVGRWLAEYSWIHLTTGPPAALLDLHRRARAAGLHVAVDPGQETHYRWNRANLGRLVDGAELLWGNRSEIERILGLLRIRTPERLLDRVPLIVRTEGTNGATAFARSGTFHVPGRRPRRVVSAVGAGDAFRGGFYAAWFAGRTLVEDLTAGTRAAARWMEGAR